jgi:uncharacterized membrane protein
MIVELTGPQGAGEFRLRPNRSLSVRGVFGFLAILGLTMLAVAAFSARQGNVYAPWFALADLGLVGGCFAWVQKRLRREERIALSAAAIDVHRRRGAQAEVLAARFHPYWVRLETGADERVLLSSHGRRVEIGAFLGEDERVELARRLARALAQLKAADDSAPRIQ